MYGRNLYRLITKGYDGTIGRVAMFNDNLVECALTAYALCRLVPCDKTGREIIDMTKKRAAASGGARTVMTVNAILRILDETPVHK